MTDSGETAEEVGNKHDSELLTIIFLSMGGIVVLFALGFVYCLAQMMCDSGEAADADDGASDSSSVDSQGEEGSVSLVSTNAPPDNGLSALGQVDIAAVDGM